MAEARWLGAAAPKLIEDLTYLDQFATAVGVKPTVATWYEPWWWKRDPAVILPKADALRAWGAIPQMTWEPFDPTLGPSQPRYKLSAIYQGQHDAYITSWAQAIAPSGQPIRIRLAHEMNFASYPWVAGRNGNTPDDYIRAWLHVRSLFTAAGATNVRWIWCPQTPFPGTVPLSALFPGDVAVDEVALDGYNWAMTNPWNSFSGVFKRGVAEVSPMTSKPITIGETGCPEAGGDKAAWIRDMWATLADWPQVKGLLWFNFNKEADWRVDSSPTALAAFKAGLPNFLA